MIDQEMSQRMSRRKAAWFIGGLTPVVTCLVGSCWTWRWLHYPLGTGCGLTLLAMLAVIIFTDSNWKKIPNWATYPTFAWLLVFNVLGTLWAGEAIDPAANETFVDWAIVGPPALGAIGIGSSLLGAIVCFSVMVVLSGWLKSAGGDVKLLTVIGACVGVQYGLLALCLGYILAGCFSLLQCLWHYGVWTVLKGVIAWLGSLLFPLWITKPQVADDQLLKTGVPLGAHFALGTIIALSRLIPGLEM